jgi:TolB-like protein/Tfp pilus assembly protein PilF
MDFGAGHEVAQGGGNLTATPLYVAPEILAGGEATQESDVYSFGVLLFHLLTGTYPVTARTIGELRRAHAEGTRASLRAMRPDVPLRIATAIERATDPVPAPRYKTASDLGRDLNSKGGGATRRWIVGGALAAGILTAVTWGTATREPQRLVIGVLPFQNLSGDPSADLVADGLTAELIGNLAAIDGLDVRSTSFANARTHGSRDIAEAGRQLGADHVLDASVVSGGTEFRVSARLVRLNDRSTVWADSLTAQRGDSLPIQSRLAVAVVNSLRMKLGSGERRYQTRPEVYYQFLRARGLQARREPEYAVQAVELFEQVTASDPSFAPAFAGLARSLGDLARLNRERESGPLDPRLETATLEALRLDPLLAEAQSALGMLYALDREWEQAAAAFTRALDLNPSATATHTDFVLTVLLPLGRLDDAITLLEKARSIDPLSLDVRRVLALVQVESGHYQQAIASTRWILERDPDFPFVSTWLGRALMLSGQTQEAIWIFEQDPRQWAYLGYAYATVNRRDEAERLAAQYPEAPAQQMLIYAGLGDRSRALDALERAAVVNPWRALTWMIRPEVGSLRTDPRFAAVRRRLNLPD